MNFARILKGVLILGVMLLPFAGCDSGGTPDKGPTGPLTPPPTKDDIAKINQGGMGMGPAKTTPKK